MPDELTTALVDYVRQVLDTNDMLATFMEEAAKRLENGDSPHRIAHYLRENAETIRESRDAVIRKAAELMDADPPEPTNALRAYLGQAPKLYPHAFKGRQDRDCQICGLPDRAHIHIDSGGPHHVGR